MQEISHKMEAKFKEFIAERYASQERHSKRFDLIQKVLEKKLGQKLYRTSDEFINKEGRGTGVRFFMDKSTASVRFNLDGANNTVRSIDVWSASTSNPDPDAKIIINNPTSTAGIINLVVKELKSPEYGIFDVDNFGRVMHDDEATDSMEVSEAVVSYGGKTYNSKIQAIQELAKKGMSYEEIGTELGVPVRNVRFYAKQAGVMSEVTVEPGKPEQMAGDNVEETQTVMDEEFADAETVFEDLEGLVKLVASKHSPSLLVLGQPGIGKTYNVTSTLDRMGLKRDEDYLLVKGMATPLGIYSALFKFRHNIIVFDDCDEALINATSLNILKGALDSSKIRSVSWLSDRTFDAVGMDDDELNARYEESGNLPNTFQLTGGVIFISNMPKSKFNINPQLRAIVTRGWWIDITLPNDDIVKLMEKALTKIEPDVDMKIKQEVLGYLRDNTDKFKGREFSFRTLIRGIQTRKLGLPNWQALLLRYA